jgi:hypothetical protein
MVGIEGNGEEHRSGALDQTRQSLSHRHAARSKP